MGAIIDCANVPEVSVQAAFDHGLYACNELLAKNVVLREGGRPGLAIAGSRPTAPGVFVEPRIHFAVNCAAVGCPALREEAYVCTPERAKAPTIRPSTGLGGTMDRALWIVKYDLPETGRDAYLDWMHGTYMPRLVERPGVSWAVHLRAEGKDVPTPGRQHAPAGAVPGGYHYSLVAGGRDAHVFADPTPAQFHAALPASDREMLAMRIGESMSVMVEQARIDGPEAGKRNPNVALSPCILLGSLNLEGGNDDEILTWFAQVRFPAMKTLPGFVGMRKLVAVSGWAKHGMVYEFESVAAMVENYPKVIQNVSPEAAASNKAIMAKSIHAPGSPNVCTRIASVLSKRHAA